MAITSISPNDPLLLWINNNATSITQAVAYLEQNLQSKVSSSDLFPDIAAYLSASNNPNVNSNAKNTATTGTGNGGSSGASSIGQYALAAPGLLGAVGGLNKGGGTAAYNSAVDAYNIKFDQALLKNPVPDGTLIGEGSDLSDYAGPNNPYYLYDGQYYSKAQIEEEITQSDLDMSGNAVDSAGQGGMLGNIKNIFTKGWFSNPSSILNLVGASAAVFGGAYGGFTLAQNLAQNPTAGGAIGLLGTAFSMFKGLTSKAFGAIISHLPILGPKLAALLANPYIAAAVVAAMIAIAVITALLGAHDAPISPIGKDINAMLAQIPSIFTMLPKSSVALMAGGLAVGGMTLSIPQGSSYTTFSVPTSQLSSAVDTATGQSGSLGKILYETGSGPNNSDTVIMTFPGANGNTQGIAFNVDSNGFLVDANGDPKTSYKTFAQPVVNPNCEKNPTDPTQCNVIGVKMNPGALEALLEDPACMATANDTALSAEKREASLETCLRNDKNVQFIPGI